ncbi:hypothetical protein [Chitinophaga niabensis]|uniref:hypothetical protein n=1 Tax=Chitinophaga niabensis TaxID=536979 RepID=UPI001161133C|nr:hypothetical protein [Chitinophaga niabensis]
MSSSTSYDKEIKGEEWSEKDSAELAHSLLVSGRIIAGNFTASSIAIYFWPAILLGNTILDKIVVVFIGLNTSALIFWVLVSVLRRKKCP